MALSEKERLMEIWELMRAHECLITSCVPREWSAVGIISVRLVSALERLQITPANLIAAHLPLASHYRISGHGVVINMARFFYAYWRATSEVVTNILAFTRADCYVTLDSVKVTAVNYELVRNRVVGPPEPEILMVPSWYYFNANDLRALAVAQAAYVSDTFVEWINCMCDRCDENDDIPCTSRRHYVLADVSVGLPQGPPPPRWN